MKSRLVNMMRKPRCSLFVAWSLIASSGCASTAISESSTASPEIRSNTQRQEVADESVTGRPVSDGATSEPNAEELVSRGLDALDQADPARAVALFSRYLGKHTDGDLRTSAYPGLARAQEQLGDFGAATRTYRAYLDLFPDAANRVEILSRQGACEAELRSWRKSAETYAKVTAADSITDALRIEALARQGYALFQSNDGDTALGVLRQADDTYKKVIDSQSERLPTFYFVGMARFYQAAVWHRRFRAIQIRASKKLMAEDYRNKLETLIKAQEAYKRTVQSKHVYWVSAAGYQWGSLFSEFYDSLMHAPIPDWLGSGGREIYFEELKNQLRPVMNRAIWVFEKNLETAKKLGYENRFVVETQERLSLLQRVLRTSDDALGQPHPYLTRTEEKELSADGVPFDGEGERTVFDEKLFVPSPTPL